MRESNPLSKPAPDHTTEIYGTLALLACVLCWGAVPVMLRHLTGAVDAWTANGVRYPLSAVLYWPILFAAYRSGSLNGDVIRRCLVPAGIALAGQVLWALAPYYLPASSIGFYARSSVVWALLATMYFFADERVLLRSWGFYGGMLLTLGGFFLLSISSHAVAAGGTLSGILIIFWCAFFFGFYGVSVRHFLRGIHPLVGFGVVSQMVSVGTLIGMAAYGKPQDLLVMSRQDWVIMAASSVIGVAMGHYFIYTAVQRLGAAIASGVGALSPFVTATLAAIFLSESLSPLQWMAGVIMVSGAVVLLSTQQLIVRSIRQREAWGAKA